MAQILDYRCMHRDSGASRGRGSAARAQNDDESYNFWGPDVVCSPDMDPSPFNPRNAQNRVLSEMMVIVGIAVLLVLLTAILA